MTVRLNHKCDFCGNWFISKSALDRHVVGHTGVKDFSCHICGAKFGRKDHMQRHIRNLHPELNKLKIKTKDQKLSGRPRSLNIEKDREAEVKHKRGPISNSEKLRSVQTRPISNSEKLRRSVQTRPISNSEKLRRSVRTQPVGQNTTGSTVELRRSKRNYISKSTVYRPNGKKHKHNCRSKSVKKEPGFEVKETCTGGTDGEKCEVDQSSIHRKKTIKTKGAKRSTRNSNAIKCAKDQSTKCSEPDKKKLKSQASIGSTDRIKCETDQEKHRTVGRNGSTKYTNVKTSKKGHRKVPDKKLKIEIRKSSRRSPVKMVYKDDHIRELGNEKFEVVLMKRSSRSTEVIDDEPDKKKPKIVLRRSSEATEYKEDLLKEPGNRILSSSDEKGAHGKTNIRVCKQGQGCLSGELQIVVRKNSETGEWSAVKDKKRRTSNRLTIEKKGSGCQNDLKVYRQEEPKCIEKTNELVKRTDNKCREKSDADRKKQNVELQKNKSTEQNLELSGQRGKHIHDNDEERNIVSVTSDPKSSNELAEYSSEDVLIVEFFEDEDKIYLNDTQKASHNFETDSTEKDPLNVDIKLIPYKPGRTEMKSFEKENHHVSDSNKDDVNDNSLVLKNEDITYTKANVVVVDFKEGIMGDCSSDISCHVVNHSMNNKPESIISETEGVCKRIEQIKSFQQVVNNTNHSYENCVEGGLNNTKLKPVEVNVIRKNDSKCNVPNPVNGEAGTNVVSDINRRTVKTKDSVVKKNKRQSDLTNKHRMKEKGKTKSITEVKRWTICKSKALGLNQKSDSKRSAVSDISDSTIHGSVNGTPAKKIDSVLDNSGRKLISAQNNGSFLDSSDNGKHKATLKPNFSNTDENERDIEEVSDFATSNINDLVLNQSFPAAGADCMEENNFKDIEDLISWTVEQSFYNDTLSNAETNKPDFEQQCRDTVPEFSDDTLKTSDGNNNCLIEVYVIDGNEEDENDNNTEEIIIYDNVLTNTNDRSQMEIVNYESEQGLFLQDTHNYHTINEEELRSICYDSQASAEINDAVNDSQVCAEADFIENEAVMPRYGDHYVDWLEVNSSSNCSLVRDSKYEKLPYWDSFLVGDLETNSYHTEKNNPQQIKSARESTVKRCANTEKTMSNSHDKDSLNQEHKSGNHEQEGPSGTSVDTYVKNNLDPDNKCLNANSVNDSVDVKYGCAHGMGAEDSVKNVKELELEPLEDGRKLSTVEEDKMELPKCYFRNTKSKKGSCRGEKLETLKDERNVSKKGLQKSNFRNTKRKKGSGRRKKFDLCTRIQDDLVMRKNILKNLKNGKFGNKPHVVRVTEQGMIIDVTEEYQQHLPHMNGS